jgi:hypothetical protein
MLCVPTWARRYFRYHYNKVYHISSRLPVRCRYYFARVIAYTVIWLVFDIKYFCKP